MGFSDFIERAVAERARQVHEIIEQACEAALQTGTMGVRVDYFADGSVRAQPRSDVPYGELHEYRDL